MPVRNIGRVDVVFINWALLEVVVDGNVILFSVLYVEDWRVTNDKVLLIWNGIE